MRRFRRRRGPLTLMADRAKWRAFLRQSSARSDTVLSKLHKSSPLCRGSAITKCITHSPNCETAYSIPLRADKECESDTAPECRIVPLTDWDLNGHQRTTPAKTVLTGPFIVTDLCSSNTVRYHSFVCI